MKTRKSIGRSIVTVVLGLWLAGMTERAEAGVMFGESPANTLGGGSRWDAAAKSIAGLGERSLDGGLRYSLQGGSFQAYRDLFQWSGAVPAVADFQMAIQQAFFAWMVTDPVSRRTTQISFVYDPNTAVVGTATGGGVDARGSEIDLFGSTDAILWDPGNSNPQAETFFDVVTDDVTLTSGTANYAGSSAISGADLTVNSNLGALYTLDFFRRLLTHEIGHALGLGDVEPDINPGAFIDDNYEVNAPATLANNWANLVDPLDPAASSGLQRYTLLQADVDGVDILMESNGLGISPGNPVTNLFPLANDDYSMRQFLYPSLTREVPAPGTLTFLGLGLGILLGIGARRRL